MLIKTRNWVTLRRLSHVWVKPEGYDTGIRVFNCITRNKQPLIVKNENCVTWYTCGPTVYDSAHIGHASCFLKLDIVQRIMKEYFKLNLVTVMNITDVDDKIIARSNALGIPAKELARQFEKEFWNDLDSLEITRPNCILRVTDNIEIIKKFIVGLVDNKSAYKTDDGCVYFDVGGCSNYGKLQNIGEDAGEVVGGKKSSMDFALWKAAKPGEIFWDSVWGQGRPGWHIECSALASFILGSEIDIHAGGIDLRFPHHENEEAQSCALHHKTQWVNYWFHTGHLHLKNSEKMSKSLKNTISISSLLQNTNAQTFRMACLMSHYRSYMEFSDDFMETASNVLKNYLNFVGVCQNYVQGLINVKIDSETIYHLINGSSQQIHDALMDDFNTPQVVNVLNEFVSSVNSHLHSTSPDSNSKSAAIAAASNFVVKNLNMFGISAGDKGVRNDSQRDFEEIMNILKDFRQGVRQLGISKKDKDVLKLCDNVREELSKCGVTLKDHGKLSSWS